MTAVTASEIARVLEGVRPLHSGEFTAKCPAHDDKHPSLSFADGNNGPVVKCHAGCSQEAVLDALAARGVEIRKPNGEVFDLDTFAMAKRLGRGFLRQCHVSDITLDNGRRAVTFEYRDRADKVTGVKCRPALDKRDDRGRFFWLRGKPRLYGLWRLDAMRTVDNRLVICEGESDALTLWENEFTALGLPGAEGWRETWLADLPEDDPIYVIIEPDKGGQAVEKWLAASELRHRAHLVRMPAEPKDPSALYLRDPDHFAERFEELLAAAVPWADTKPAHKSRLRQAAEIVSDPLPAAWLLRPYLEQMVLALLYGELGALKSFVTLDMLLSIAAGKPWGGSASLVKAQPVIYVTAEGRGLRNRLRAWAIQHNVDLAKLPFYALERALDLSTDEGLDGLVIDIEALDIEPAIIAIDTLSKNKGPLDENANTDMSLFLSQLDAKLRQPFKATVLLVHHVGHGAKDRSRGAYSLMADTDANYLVERPDPHELAIKITTGRLKDSESPAPLFLKARIVDLGTVDDEGNPETSLVLLPTEDRPQPKKRPSGKSQMAILRLLEQEHRAGNKTWTVADVRALARERLDMPKQTAHDATNTLINNGFMKSTVGGLVLADPPKGPKSPKRSESDQFGPGSESEKSESPLGTRTSDRPHGPGPRPSVAEP